VGESAFWRDWVLVALAGLPSGRADSELAVIEEVAIRFADRFGPADRLYDADRPRWHDEVRQALAALQSEGLVQGRDAPELTTAGRDYVETVRESVERAGAAAAELTAGEQAPADDERLPLLTPGVIAPPLRSAVERGKIGFPTAHDEPVPVMAEINLRYRLGADAAFERLERLWLRVAGDRRPSRLSEQYASGKLSMNEMERLVAADAAPVRWPDRSIHRLWPDFPVQLHIDGSCVTVKADASRRAFNAYGDGIVWAVVDSGVWGDHPHFAAYETLTHDDVRDLHRLFPVEGDPTAEGALVDESGHGTHVAGIIAGAIAPWLDGSRDRTVRVTENRYNVENPREPLRVPREVNDMSLLAGMAPKARLVSLKVLQAGGSLDDRVGRVIKALAYVRKVNGESVDGMRIHGVNLSIGYEFSPEWFACGQSPLCNEVDKLVRSGVVVVVAAGNSGYGALAVRFDAPTKFALGMTINDPGNTERAITVGATHRDAPHAYGVSYFSSKGPTGDGRRKPDLVAPGERITSCAAGQNLAAVVAGAPDPTTAVYVEDSGTSMAAPHVSGAVAALLSVHREYIGRPELVKQIILDAATSLGRGMDFQGSGLLDLMRALQSV
jgi:serine protease AprX